MDRTLRTPYFARRLGASEIEAVFSDLRVDALIQPLSIHVIGVATHRQDDMILATAVSAGAPFLVTGDKPLLARGSYQGTRLLTPRPFLTVLDRK
jgi:predicted nucleic acid-binding protein